MSAEGHITRGFGDGETDNALEPQALRVNQGDGGDGNAADLGGQAGDVVEGVLGGRVQEAALLQPV